MSDSKSKLVEKLLAKPELHREWVSRYRTAENEPFFDRAFDNIIDVLKPLPAATFLDVGCGSCAHSVRLALRGMNVRAVDFSESALKMAEEQIRERGLSNSITLGRENILELSFPDESFDYVLCWGVLMHIPDIERAVSELSRVVKPGGFLVLSETNMSSFEAMLTRGVKRVLGKGNTAKRTPAGIEFWKAIGQETIVTRQSDIEWLTRSFAKNGLEVTRHMAGQFSEGYAVVSSRLIKKLIHGFNNLWFSHVRFPRFAHGNIFFLQKENPQIQARARRAILETSVHQSSR